MLSASATSDLLDDKPKDSSAVTQQPPGAHPRTARPWLPVVMAMVAVAWGGNEFTPLLVMYRQVSNFSMLTVDVLLGAYVLGIVPALLIGGPLSDRYGRRVMLMPAVPLGIVGSLVIACFPASAAAMALGRILSGLALGLGMAVGTTWVKELSLADPPAAGPSRAALSLTGGFLVGAGLAGGLAQWGPLPTLVPYLVHIGLSVLAAMWLTRAPETRTPLPVERRGSLRDDLKVPAVSHRRFLLVVVPLAPWVFGAVGSAYAVLPNLMMGHAGGTPIAFSGLLTVVTLSVGVGIQVVARLIDSDRSARASVLALGILAVGMALAAWASSTLSLPVVIAAACVLGAGYGLALVAGLCEVQRIASPDDLAGLTAVYYSIGYLGFFIPAIMALISPHVGYPEMFGFGTVAALCCLTLVAAVGRRHLPSREA